MDPGDQRITLDDFSLWKIEALRSFLSCRGLSTTGNKQELVALAFAAIELNLPLVPHLLKLRSPYKIPTKFYILLVMSICQTLF